MRVWIPSDNRPHPVLGTRIPFLEDEHWQMSFGERAALEGLLANLRPARTVEVGTYEGGSLRCLARFSERVHTIDQFSGVEDPSAFPNVSFHVGDSAEVLPRLLDELGGADQQVDFVLIDGDHSFDGVRRDLEHVLGAAATATAVVVLHDTANDETRAGIDAALSAGSERVSYADLDFVSGYEFSRGVFAGEVWGGLGLVVLGPERSPGYTASPAQSLYVGAVAHRHELADARTEVARLSRELADLSASTSWRLTAPLRRAKHTLRRLMAS